MTDVFTKPKRSEVMSRIRGRGNKNTELALAKLLRVNGVTGWRRHVEIRGRAALPRSPKIGAARQHRPTFRVKPDFVFPRINLAIFVDGCFWHSCPSTGQSLKAIAPSGNASWPQTSDGTASSTGRFGRRTGGCCGFGSTHWRRSKRFRHLTRSPHPQPLSTPREHVIRLRHLLPIRCGEGNPMGEGGVGLSPSEAERVRKRG
jgi:G:T-mismatch repair DNA endonuclease (very short patch repair protein)